MRKRFVSTLERLVSSDPKMVLLLGDIGVFGFRNSMQAHADRVYNIGILEQATVSLAAGLSMEGFVPVVHTIAPFLIERSLEQLKDDFCYQKLGGNFVSVGASYDYAALGCTHHCPGDVGILKNLPEMEIVLPGTSDEFEKLFETSYNNSHPTYFRLSERENATSQPVEFGKAVVVKKGTKATIVAVGTTLDIVLAATEKMDVTVLYYTTVTPFDAEALKNNCPSDKILLVEPYYKGGLVKEIMATMKGRKIALETVGVPLQFLNKYGTASQHDKFVGLTIEGLQQPLQELIGE